MFCAVLWCGVLHRGGGGAVRPFRRTFFYAGGRGRRVCFALCVLAVQLQVHQPANGPAAVGWLVNLAGGWLVGWLVGGWVGG